jgi:hypothetical protein
VPITVAAGFNTQNIYAHSKTGIAGSSSTGGMDLHLGLFGVVFRVHEEQELAFLPSRNPAIFYKIRGVTISSERVKAKVPYS